MKRHRGNPKPITTWSERVEVAVTIAWWVWFALLGLVGAISVVDWLAPGDLAGEIYRGDWAWIGLPLKAAVILGAVVLIGATSVWLLGDFVVRRRSSKDPAA